MGLATGATVALALSSPGVGHRKNPNIKTVYNKILLSAIAFHFCSIHKHNTQIKNKIIQQQQQKGCSINLFVIVESLNQRKVLTICQL